MSKQRESAIYARIQTARGMCSDEVPYPELDAYLAEIAEMAYDLERSDSGGTVPSRSERDARPDLTLTQLTHILHLLTQQPNPAGTFTEVQRAVSGQQRLANEGGEDG